MRLENKVALVTGASRGIGRATALALAAEGAHVGVNYAQNAAAAEEVVKRIAALDRRAAAMRANVRNLEEVKQMVAKVEDTLGPIDILVNNAGIARDNFLRFMKDDEWSDVVDTSLKGAFHCIKAVTRGMIRRRTGSIVNVSSDAGLLGDMMRANYSSAKAGMLGLTKAAARELAASGITVNAVAPGIIETDLIEGMSPPKREKQLARIPQQRFGQPSEVAALIVFLASDDADYMTGQVVCVDGGLRM